MNHPENMTLQATVESGSDSGKTKNQKRAPRSLSDNFSWPGRIAILLAVVLSPWGFASVPYWAQCWIMILLLVGLGFWWFETALNKHKSQIFPYMFYLVAIGLLIGLVQLIPLPDWILEIATGRQKDIYREFSGDPNAAVTISMDREGTWHQIRLLIMGITGLLLGCRFFRTKRDIILLLTTVSANGVLISFAGIIQRLTNSENLFAAYGVSFLGFGPFVNKNNAAGYLLMCLACALGLMAIVFSKKKRPQPIHNVSQSNAQATYFQLLEFISELNARKISLLLVIALLSIGIVSTISRGAVIGLLGAGIATVLIYGLARRPKNSFMIFFPVAGLVIALSSWLGFGEALTQRFEKVQLVGMSESNIRLAHWKDTSAAIGDLGPLGSGLGSYRGVHRLYRTDHEGGIFEYAENQYFQSLVEAGWGGLSVFLLAWGLAFNYFSLLLFKGNSPTSIGIGTCGVFCVFSQAIVSFFDFGLYIPSNLLLFSVLIGFLGYHGHSLATRLKESSWLRCSTPNFLVQAIVLILVFCAIMATLELNKLSAIDSLAYPQATKLNYDNLDATSTDERINQLTAVLQQTQSVEGLNYLGELYLHRSRLALLQSLIEEYELQRSGAIDGSDLNSEQENNLANVFWDLTEVQRVQENAYYLKTNEPGNSASTFLNSQPIREYLPMGLNCFLLSRQKSPLQPVIHLRIGEIRGALGILENNGAGDEDIERALQLAPSNANFRLVAGVHYLQSGNADAAAPHLRAFLQLMPEKFEYLMDLLTGRESRSITFVSEKLIGQEIIPDDPTMLYEYATTYLPSFSLEKKAILNRAIEILADTSHSRRELTILSGDIRTALQEPDLACQDYNQALISQPHDPKTRHKLVIALLEAGKTEEAFEEAKRLVDGSPSNGTYILLLKEIKSSLEQKRGS